MSVLLGSRVTGVVFPGVGAMSMICGACFSFLGRHTLHSRPGPPPEPGLVLRCLLGQSPARSQLCLVLQAVPWGTGPLDYRQEGVGQREIHFSGHVWSTEVAVNHFSELCCVSQGDLTNAALPEICRIQAYVFLFRCSPLLPLVPTQRGCILHLVMQ